DVDRPLGAPKRIHGHLVQVVDGGLLDPVLASLRAFHSVLPGADASLLVWWERADERWTDLDSAHRAAPHLQRAGIHSNGCCDVLSRVPSRARRGEDDVHLCPPARSDVGGRIITVRLFRSQTRTRASATGPSRSSSRARVY